MSVSFIVRIFKIPVFIGMIGVIVMSSILQPVSVQAASNSVVPINYTRLAAGKPADVSSKRVGSILLNTNRYAMSTWYVSKGFTSSTQQTATYLNFGGVGEQNIRPSASQALALAVSLKTGLYDPVVTTKDTYGTTTKTVKLIRSLAYRHKANLAGGWGDNWQSGLWAAYAGTAGWLLWDSPYMSTIDRTNIQKMVEYEANRFIGYKVPYYKDATGTILTPGDSKAEENAWNAMILQTATAMMPNHANYDAWNYKNHELMLSAFSSPSDVANPATIHGQSYAGWLRGSNIANDGTLINHSRIHPDYMTTISQNNYSALTSSLAGKPTPQAAFHNNDTVFAAMVDLKFNVDSGYAAPGGTMYQAGSSNIYYPQGNDWGTDRRMHFALTDIQAQAFGYDTAATKSGAYWDAYHSQRVLNMQNSNSDRRTYTTAAQDTYAGREEWVAAHAAQAYLTKWLLYQSSFSRSGSNVPIVVDNEDRGFAAYGGTWAGSAGPADRLGSGVRYIGAGIGSAKARFDPNLSVAGTYNVYAWWTAYPNHATNAPYDIISNNMNIGTVRTNQEIDGGKWNLLGTFRFEANNNAIGGNYVELTNDANEYVTADAVKFEYVP